MTYIPTERLIRSTRRTLDSLLQARGESYGRYNVLGVFMESKLIQYQMMLEKLLYSLLLLDASQKKHRSAHARSSRRTPRGGRMTRRKGRAQKGGAPSSWTSLFSWATTTQSVTNPYTAPMLALNFRMPYANVDKWCSTGLNTLVPGSCRTINETFDAVDIKANEDMAQFVMSLQQIEAAQMTNHTADNNNSYLVLEWAPNKTFSGILEHNKNAKLAKLYSPGHKTPTDVVNIEYKARLSDLVSNTGQGRYPLSGENPYEYVYTNCTRNFVTLLFDRASYNLTDHARQELDRAANSIRLSLFGLETKKKLNLLTGFVPDEEIETSNGKGWLSPISLFTSMDIGYNGTDYLGPRKIVLSYRAFWQRAFAEHMHRVLLTKNHDFRAQLSDVLSNMQVSTFVNNHHNIELWRAMLPRLMQHPQIALETVLAMGLAANKTKSGEIPDELQRVLDKLQEDQAKCHSDAHGKLQPYCQKGYEPEKTHYERFWDLASPWIRKGMGEMTGISYPLSTVQSLVTDLYNSTTRFLQRLFYNILALLLEWFSLYMLAQRTGGPIIVGVGVLTGTLRIVINYLWEMTKELIITFIVVQLVIYAYYARDVEWKWQKSSRRKHEGHGHRHKHDRARHRHEDNRNDKRQLLDILRRYVGNADQHPLQAVNHVGHRHQEVVDHVGHRHQEVVDHADQHPLQAVNHVGHRHQEVVDHVGHRHQEVVDHADQHPLQAVPELQVPAVDADWKDKSAYIRQRVLRGDKLTYNTKDKRNLPVGYAVNNADDLNKINKPPSIKALFKQLHP